MEVKHNESHHGEAPMPALAYIPESRSVSRGALGDYLNQTEQCSGGQLLSADQEIELARAIANGDTHARDTLIRANVKLVIRIATQYRGRGLSIEDLVGEGNLGLIRAAEDFDATFGVRFSTYAAYWIKQAIRLALTNTAAVIRLPSHMVGMLHQWSKTEHQLEKELGRNASFDEVADRMDLSENHRTHVRKALKSRSLAIESAMIEGDNPWTIESLATEDHAPEQSLEAEEQRIYLSRRLMKLNDRERAVITLRYGLHGQEVLTWSEIGARLGITREWARKIEQRALEKMRSEQTEVTSKNRFNRSEKNFRRF
jgi:RNA polymerase primary sigma factor